MKDPLMEMTTPERHNYLIAKSEETVKLVVLIEKQIREIRVKYNSSDKFEDILHHLEPLRMEEDAFRRRLSDYHSMMEAMRKICETSKAYMERIQNLKQWKYILDNWSETQTMKEEMTRFKKEQEMENQRILDEKEAEVERILEGSKTDKVEMTRLQTILEENSVKDLDVQRLLKDSEDENAHLKTELQKYQEVASCLQKALADEKVENLKLQRLLEDSKQEENVENFQRLLKNSDAEKAQECTPERHIFQKNQESGCQKNPETRIFHEEIGKLYMENQRLKAEQPEQSIQANLKPEQPVGTKSEQPVGTKPEQHIQVYRKPEQPGQKVVQMESKSEQPIRNVPLNPDIEQPTHMILEAEQPDQKLVQLQSEPEKSEKPKTEQPIHHIPRSLPKTDQRTPKDFQFKNLIHANRQLSAQQSDYHKTTSHEDIDIMTEHEQSATVTSEMNALKMENKELKTKFEMINL